MTLALCLAKLIATSDGDRGLMEIRAEQSEDVEAIRDVNIAAFERTNEADLVDRLRQTDPTLSFVAVEAGRVVGHIFFSLVSVAGQCTQPSSILGLAPLAVLPHYQKQGIGSSLVRHSLSQAANLGFSAIVVLGDPAYYSRFGFITAKEKNLSCEYPVPDEAFMVVELQDGALQNCCGTIKYRSEFAGL